MPPARIIARAIADDAVGGEDIAHRLDHHAQVEPGILKPVGGFRRRPAAPFVVRLFAAVEIDQLVWP